MDMHFSPHSYWRKKLTQVFCFSLVGELWFAWSKSLHDKLVAMATPEVTEVFFLFTSGHSTRTQHPTSARVRLEGDEMVCQSNVDY